MNRRSLASSLVFSLLVLLFATAAFLPVPYVTESPGPTVNVLGSSSGKPIITVRGHQTYKTEGDLRLTTVSVTNPTHRIGLGEALTAWFDGARAVYPRDVIYPPEQSAQDVETQSAVEMVSSQDLAIAAALHELGYTLPLRVEVVDVTKGAPADGKLQTRDRIVSVDGTKITDVKQVTTAIQAAGIGTAATIVVRRGGATKTVTLTPKASPDDARKAAVGVQIQPGYDFPFDVSVRLGEDIGGPSAGLIFSLGVYDTLTPGSLTGGTDIAGTGTISAKGRVGPIGGIQQKIVAAADAGAKIFLVPPANCDSALNADVTKDDITLVKAPTMHSAVTSLKSYAADPSAPLPACS
ncbi:MAG: PDZ domain-containing protein [Nocardioidaceae bacterium]